MQEAQSCAEGPAAHQRGRGGLRELTPCRQSREGLWASDGKLSFCVLLSPLLPSIFFFSSLFISPVLCPNHISLLMIKSARVSEQEIEASYLIYVLLNISKGHIKSDTSV